MDTNQHRDTALIGGGCFWCIEAVFQQVIGVEAVHSGYAGGHIANPEYKAVCEGTTGHAEVCQIIFDTTKITYKELLTIFFAVHDPTTLNRQGNDAGTQYRSVIFARDAQQKLVAQQTIAELTNDKIFSSPIVTQVVDDVHFYIAEAYHQNYYRTHPDQGYCSFVVRPKVEKFQKLFKDKLRKE